MDFSVDETALGVSILKFIMDTTLFLFFFFWKESFITLYSCPGYSDLQIVLLSFDKLKYN